MDFDLDNLRQMVRGGSPHMSELGLDLIDVEPGRVKIRLPWQERLIGNPELRILHGGVITVLLDTASGMSVHAALGRFEPIATLDLRIDYLRPAEPDRPVHARAHCYRVTRNVCFTRAIAYHDDPDRPIAHGAGSFMRATAGPSPAAKPNG